MAVYGHQFAWASAISTLTPRARLLGLVLACVLILAGCAAPKVTDVDPQAAWQTRLDALAHLYEWSAFGRIGIKVPDDAWSASVEWRQRHVDYQVRLSGPLGQGMVTLDGKSSGVVLRTADGKIRRAASPEALLAGVFGWRLPVSGLTHWMLGRPDPRTPLDDLTLDSAGLPKTMEQAGWRIEYERFFEVDGVEMPGKLFLSSPRATVKVLVKRWELGS